MPVSTILDNGAIITCKGLFSNVLLVMQREGWFGQRGHGTAPFIISANGVITKSEFTLLRADLLHATALMFQRCFPTSSWKYTWKRKSNHQQWLTTQDVVQLVVFDARYNQLCCQLLTGEVRLSTLQEFEYFRRYMQNGEVLEVSAVQAWQHATFITSELMRELDCKQQPHTVRLYTFA